MSMKTYLPGRGGLFANETRKARVSAFISLLLVAASMTFMQLGFVALDTGTVYTTYLLALLAPISVAALLLGWLPGSLMGLACGAILLAHSRLMPLDPIEGYLINPLNSMLLYAGAGLVLGLIFDAMRKRKLSKLRKYLGIALACTAVSALSTWLLDLSLMISDSTYEQIKAYVYSSEPIYQILCDALLMTIACVAAELLVRRYNSIRHHLSMQIIFRSNLFVTLLIAYLMISSVAFIVITGQEKDMAYYHMDDELTFISDELNNRWRQYEYLSARVNEGQLTRDDLIALRDMIGVQRLIDGYDLDEGSIFVVSDETVLFSNSPMFKPNKSLGNALDMESVVRVANKDSMERILYDDGSFQLQLGYMRAKEAMKGTYVVMLEPFTLVFDFRENTMFWASLVTSVLLTMLFVMVARLLHKVVMDPINGMNHSLSKIMEGNLDEIVHEVGSVEFAALSAGINATVDALKGWIDEVKKSIERDLATARAIQEGALPKHFPAFPDVDCLNLYATMNSARDVGGDFYDFFAIDDHTVCFLIADVSGKGIPGALFMMSAKTEIQHNLSSGAELADAIATANEYLCAHNDAGMFVTVWAATLDWKTGLLTYVNAGHNYPLLRHGRNGSWEWIDQKCGLFLGTFETAKYHQKTLTLEKGDELLLYTDGVNEAFNADGDEYGNDRLEAFLGRHSNERPRELVQELRADVGVWAEGAEQSDDITILAVEYGA